MNPGASISRVGVRSAQPYLTDFFDEELPFPRLV